MCNVYVNLTYHMNWRPKQYYDFMKIRIRRARADGTHDGIRMFNCNDVRRYCSEYGVRVVFMQNYSNGSAGLDRFRAPFAYPLAKLQCNNAGCIRLTLLYKQTRQLFRYVHFYPYTHILYYNIFLFLPSYSYV